MLQNVSPAKQALEMGARPKFNSVKNIYDKDLQILAFLISIFQ